MGRVASWMLAFASMTRGVILAPMGGRGWGAPDSANLHVRPTESPTPGPSPQERGEGSPAPQQRREIIDEGAGGGGGGAAEREDGVEFDRLHLPVVENAGEVAAREFGAAAP
jgi:hypothetical protein